MNTLYNKNFMFLSRTVLEKNAMLICNFSKLFFRTIVQFLIFARYHRIFLKNCATEEDFFVYKESILVNIQKNLMFFSRTVLQKNAMISCKF